MGRTFESGLCQTVRDVSQDPDFDAEIDARTGFKTRSLLSTPLLSGHGIVGVLQVLNKRGGLLFDESDHLLLRALGAVPAISGYD